MTQSEQNQLEMLKKQLKQTQQKLRDVEKKYQLLSEASFEGFLVHEQGVILEANPNIAAMLRCDLEDLPGLNLLQDVVHPDSLEKALTRIKSGSEEPYDLKVLRRDGTTFFAEVCAKNIELEGRSVRVLAVRDITARKKMEDELRQAKANLEKMVEKRTAQLKEQQDIMLELSTPVIQIWEGILILPLIGTIDSRRAGQIMQNTLEAISHKRAKQVIIDITGVPFVDTEVANHLIKTIQAAKLVGAKCILVGISSEVAQTLVHIGIDLEHLD
ncbi:MAG: STAS domain-containing protein, partial [Gemmatimonadetes bacterium]